MANKEENKVFCGIKFLNLQKNPIYVHLRSFEELDKLLEVEGYEAKIRFRGFNRQSGGEYYYLCTSNRDFKAAGEYYTTSRFSVLYKKSKDSQYAYYCKKCQLCNVTEECYECGKPCVKNSEHLKDHEHCTRPEHTHFLHKEPFQPLPHTIRNPENQGEVQPSEVPEFNGMFQFGETLPTESSMESVINEAAPQKTDSGEEDDSSSSSSSESSSSSSSKSYTTEEEEPVRRLVKEKNRWRLTGSLKEGELKELEEKLKEGEESQQIFTEEVLEHLFEWIMTNYQFPYPKTTDLDGCEGCEKCEDCDDCEGCDDCGDCVGLVEKTGLSNAQIKDWYSNKRKRKWKSKLEEILRRTDQEEDE